MAFVVVAVDVAESAASGAPFWRSIVCLWTSSDEAVTDGLEVEGSSSSSSDVRWTPRLVAWAELKREVGYLVEGEEENES